MAIKSRFRLWKSRTSNADEKPAPSPVAAKSPDHPKHHHSLDTEAGSHPEGTPSRSKPKRGSSVLASADTRPVSRSKDGGKPKGAKKGGLYSLFSPKIRKHNKLQDDDSDNDEEDELTFDENVSANNKSQTDDPFAEFEGEMGIDFEDDGSKTNFGRDRKRSRHKGDRLREASPQPLADKSTDSASASVRKSRSSSTLKRFGKVKGGGVGRTPKPIGRSPKPRDSALLDSLTNTDGAALLSSNPFDDY